MYKISKNYEKELSKQGVRAVVLNPYSEYGTISIIAPYLFSVNQNSIVSCVVDTGKIILFNRAGSNATNFFRDWIWEIGLGA